MRYIYDSGVQTPKLKTTAHLIINSIAIAGYILAIGIWEYWVKL